MPRSLSPPPGRKVLQQSWRCAWSRSHPGAALRSAEPRYRGSAGRRVLCKAQRCPRSWAGGEQQEPECVRGGRSAPPSQPCWGLLLYSGLAAARPDESVLQRAGPSTAAGGRLKVDLRSIGSPSPGDICMSPPRLPHWTELQFEFVVSLLRSFLPRSLPPPPLRSSLCGCWRRPCVAAPLRMRRGLPAGGWGRGEKQLCARPTWGVQGGLGDVRLRESF